MKPRKDDETDAQYIARLERQNASLRDNNRRITAWADRVGRAVTMMATEGSLVFQAMAEKAGVRGHPSVSAAVQMFDQIAHPQWGAEQVSAPEWPDDWNFDDDGQWSGDADMSLNSPISDVIEFLESYHFHGGKVAPERIHSLVTKLNSALRARVECVKDAHGFKPKHLSVPSKHFRDMSREELLEVVSAMGWVALDLAQDMEFANEILRRDLRASTYRRVCGDLYALSQIAVRVPEKGEDQIRVKVLGDEAIPF